MKRCALLSIALFSFLFLFLGTPQPASGQGFYFGAGPTFPTGDYGDYAKTGYLGVAGVSFSVGPAGLSAFGEGFFGQNSHKDVDGDKTLPYGGMGGLLFDFWPEKVGGPYAFGQAGFMVHKFSSDMDESSSDTGFGFGGGAGYGFPVGDTEIFLEGRYMRGSFDDGSTAFFGIMGGVALSFGG